MKQKRGSIQSYGSISNVEGYEPIPDGSDYEEDEDINGNCKLKIYGRYCYLFFNVHEYSWSLFQKITVNKF